MAKKKTSSPNFLLAAVLAWLVPGAGHAYSGWHYQNQLYREVDDKLSLAPPKRGGRPGERRMVIDSELAERNVALVYPVDIAARAYAGVAGLLNLLCIFDAATLALMGVTGEPSPTDETAKQTPEPGASPS